MSPFLSTQNSDTKKTGPDHCKFCSENYNSNLMETRLEEVQIMSDGRHEKFDVIINIFNVKIA